MLNLAKSDLYRMLRSKGMYFFFASIAAVYIICVATKTPVGIAASYSHESLTHGFPLDIKMAGFNNNYYYLLFFPVSVILIADFRENTIKNTLSSVTSKTKYYIFKSLLIQCVSIISFAAGNLFFYILNRSVNGEGFYSEPEEFFTVILLQLPIIVLISSVLTFFAVLFKRQAVFNAVLLIVPSLYSLALELLIRLDLFKSFIREYLSTLNFSFIFQGLAGDSDTSYAVNIILLSTVMSLTFFIGGLKVFNKTEALK